ncbi:hypothetical protein FPANT_10573 [Fusarium pseudoanthophilum]|uniref:BTB domain-containing protein n=1 Tax=Fusarium pseudoanthophilum TaxID=48495 RepID=A0A8H5KRF8_9HYPO|nr:hypothetical protein FPANT_10573 [Fusarium pseudoanthophilum]
MPVSEVYEVQESGDTLLILCNAGATFATPDTEDEWPNALPEHQTELSRCRESSIIPRKSQRESSETLTDISSPTEAKPEPLHMRFRVSSAILINTSAYFRKSLSGDWKETAPEPGYKWTLTASDWDAEAFHLLMRILHHKAREVPRTIELETLAKVAVLVDYYGCHEAVDLWAETWISNVDEEMAESFYSRELLLKLTISWVFSDKKRFRSLTEVAIRTSRGPIPTLRLPIPDQVVVAIEQSRVSSIAVLIEGIEKYWDIINRRCVNDMKLKMYSRQSTAKPSISWVQPRSFGTSRRQVWCFDNMPL